jgi:hypothetical protein
VTNRTHITPWQALSGPRGDVCPEPATLGTKLRHLGRIAGPAVVAAQFGGQNGGQAFVVDRREVPT